MSIVDRLRLLVVGAFCCMLIGANGCGPQPAPVPPGALGGFPSFGGFAPFVGGAGAGGQNPEGGRPGVGGEVSTGGATATGGAPQADIQWPECAPASQKIKKQNLDELRKRLGRHRDGPITKRAKASYTVVAGLADAFWLPLAPTIDQLDLGSCTGNAAVQVRVSKPWTWVGTLDPLELEKLAISIYSGATRRDPFEGAYPPDDTGSNGASAMAELKSRGLISGWTSVVTFEGLQRALQSGPCVMGSNWYTGMFSPDRCGQLSLTGVNEGGHETTAKGVQFSTKRILFQNSWGNEWGAALPSGQAGFFWLKFGDVQRLMNEGAEFECPTVAISTATMKPANDNEFAIPWREAS